MLKHIGKNSAGAVGLLQMGPMVRVMIHPPTRQPAPGEASVLAHLMVDTGAQKTCVSEDVLQQAGLAPVRTGNLVGVSGKPERCPLYRACIELVMADGAKTISARFVADVFGVRALGHVDGLLGRDFLSNVRLMYDGPMGVFEIIDIRAPGPVVTKLSSPDRSKAKVKRKAAEQARRKNRSHK